MACGQKRYKGSFSPVLAVVNGLDFLSNTLIEVEMLSGNIRRFAAIL